MIDNDIPLDELIGAMVRYDDQLIPEYGLVQGGNPTGTALFVRYGAGDTAQSTLRRQLTVVVPAVRNADRELFGLLRARLDEAKAAAKDVIGAIDALSVASEGDSADAEYAAAVELGGAARRLVDIIQSTEYPSVKPVVEFPLSLSETQEIVGFLLGLGDRGGLLHGNTLNTAMGASARRRAGTADAPPYPGA